LLREFVLFISFDEQRYPMHSVDGHISASLFFAIFTNATWFHSLIGSLLKYHSFEPLTCAGVAIALLSPRPSFCVPISRSFRPAFVNEKGIKMSCEFGPGRRADIDKAMALLAMCDRNGGLLLAEALVRLNRAREECQKVDLVAAGALTSTRP
jgi:hypothetical protein